jgi:membrane-associated phospholipid phosphatase
LGDRNTYLVIIALLAAYFWLRSRNWKITLQVSAVLVLSTLTNIALKRVINRSRPSLEHLVDVNTLSFPSGHSMSAMAFYGFLMYLTIIGRVNRWLKLLLAIVLMFLILSIGISRIYLGVHYPSDVAAGFFGGLIWVAFSAIVFNIIDLLRRKRTHEASV